MAISTRIFSHSQEISRACKILKKRTLSGQEHRMTILLPKAISHLPTVNYIEMLKK